MLIKYIYDKLSKTDLDILMIDQYAQIQKNEKISDFVLKANEEMYFKHIEFDNLQEKEELTDEEIILYGELSEYLIVNEWEKFNSESKKIMTGMGFNDINIDTNVLSGGFLMRGCICRALLRKPTLLILDEINNHLDLNSCVFLTNYLETYPKSLIVVSHNIDLINAISNIIWYIGDLELTGNRIYSIRGNFNDVLKKKEEINKKMEKDYDKFQKELKKLRNKSIPKKQVDEYIKENFAPRVPKEYKVNIKFDDIVSLGNNRIIEFNDVKFSYGEKMIFKKLNLTINEGDKIILLGPNAAGKSTFFKLCEGLKQPNNGYILKDNRLRISYVDQMISDNLPLELTPIEYLQSINNNLNYGDYRAILGKLGILKKDGGYDLPKTQLKFLSGGEKSRVKLAAEINLKCPHMILFDEITNHADYALISALIDAINNYAGSVLIISHDTFFVKSINNAILYEVKDNDIKKLDIEFDEYVDKIIN